MALFRSTFSFPAARRGSPQKDGPPKPNRPRTGSTVMEGDPWQTHIFPQRATVAIAVAALLFLLLLIRLFDLQLLQGERYRLAARENHIRLIPIEPPRGVIYDRMGRVLAENLPAYRLALIPDQTPDLEMTLRRLREVVELSDEEIARFRKRLKRFKPFEAVPLKFRLTEAEIARFAARQPFFPGVVLQVQQRRHYPYGRLLAHLVGYVGLIDREELQRADPRRYQSQSFIGKSGLEKRYEYLLHGELGYREVEINAYGRPIRVLRHHPPKRGSDLFLTIDLHLQEAARLALGERRGAVVALDPHTGEILALFSNPSFDPNPFVLGLPKERFRSLQRDPDRPLFNRAIAGRYPPGSTIKPFVALAGLWSGEIRPTSRRFCPGYYRLPGRRRLFRDWKRSGHGRVDLYRAIVESCDVYFYDLAHRLGIDRLHAFLSRFGFGSRTGIDLPGEGSGLLPSRTWKRKRFGQIWYPGETVILGIGQGYLQVTPLQLAKATALLANRGRPLRPHLALAYRPPGSQETIRLAWSAEDPPISLPPSAWRAVTRAMVGVVHSPHGTAHRIARGLTYRIAGKTGTAQVFSLKKGQRYDEKRLKRELRDHALFIAFAPAEEPKIAVSVVAEHAGHGGSAAAPVARDLIDFYLKRSVRSSVDDLPPIGSMALESRRSSPR